MQLLKREIERVRDYEGSGGETDFRGSVRTSMERVVRRVARRRRGTSAGERYLLSRLDGLDSGLGERETGRLSLPRRISSVADNITDKLVMELLSEFDRQRDTLECCERATVVAG
jgi:hypothetical protein